MAPITETDFDAGIVALAFSDAGLLAAALGDGSVQLLHSDGDVRPVLAHEGAALCLTLDTDGLGFVTGGDDGRVVRSSPDGTTTELLKAPNRQIDVLAVFQSAKTMAVAVGREVRLLNRSGAVQAIASDHP